MTDRKYWVLRVSKMLKRNININHTIPPNTHFSKYWKYCVGFRYINPSAFSTIIIFGKGSGTFQKALPKHFYWHWLQSAGFIDELHTNAVIGNYWLWNTFHAAVGVISHSVVFVLLTCNLKSLEKFPKLTEYFVDCKHLQNRFYCHAIGF